jgi:branched-chain amino acid transport system ATP-binding protein
MNEPGTDAPLGALTLDHVSVSYAGALALVDVSIEVRPGAVTAVLGPNGAGKTTLAGVASGMLRPDTGHVTLDGADITAMPAWKRARMGVASLPERGGFFPKLSVRENLKMSFRHLGGRSAQAAAIAEAESMFPVLGRRRRQAAGVLSGGEQQMLALARVFCSHPRTIIIDELSHGLAPLILDQLFAMLGERKGTVSMLLIEQYLDRALGLADDVVVLSQGVEHYTGPAVGLSMQEVERFYKVSVD